MKHIDSLIDEHGAFIEKANSYISRMLKELNTCPICYDRAISKDHNFDCKRHHLCGPCFNRSKCCPFCRSQRNDIIPDLYISRSSWDSNSLELLTTHTVLNGFDDNYDYTNYISKFASTMRRSVKTLNEYQPDLHTVKTFISIVANNINRKTNFPIFAWRNSHELQYSYDRWQTIELRLIDFMLLHEVPIHQQLLRLRRALATVLKKIKLLVINTSGSRLRVRDFQEVSLAGLRAPPRATPLAGSSTYANISTSF